MSAVLCTGAGERASDEQHAEAKEKLSTPDKEVDITAPPGIR